jgi:uncharacterized protein YcnI
MRFRYSICAALAALIVVPAATAHVTASPAELSTGYTYTQFSVPHGCDGSATTSISIEIPAGIANVAPEVVAGWEIETQEGALPEPVNIFGEETTEGITQVTWTGGPLPDPHLQRFGLSFYASDSLADQTVYWPVVQQCENGVNRWIEIPVEGEEEPEEPAAGISFLASASEGEEEPAEETAATGDASADEATPVPAASSDDSSDRANFALVLGALGLVAGLAALALVLFRKPRQTA